MANKQPDPKEKRPNDGGSQKDFSRDRPEPKNPRPKLPKVESNSDSNKD